MGLGCRVTAGPGGLYPLGFFLFEKPSEWNNSPSTGSGALGLVVSASKWPTPKPEAGNSVVFYWAVGYQLWGSTDHSRDATGLTGTAVWLSQSHTPASLTIVFFFFFIFSFFNEAYTTNWLLQSSLRSCVLHKCQTGGTEFVTRCSECPVQ